jgi:Mrp family chromosome partitioning ATPase
MGRMSDLWKPGPTSGTGAPVLEVVTDPAPPLDDWFGGEASVPFIEVGAPVAKESAPEPSPRVEPIVPPVVRAAAEPEPVLKLLAEPLPPGLFTVRFRPVVAGALPGRGFGPELIAFHDPDHPISEQYRLLLGEVALQLPGGPPRVLLLTGATAEAGTTTVLLNLAVTLARTDALRVTVIDANVARPAVAERLGLSPGPGLCEVLGGRTPLPWAVQNTRLPNLRALVAGRATVPAAETAFPPVVERLRTESDWVLIDGPTSTRPADAAPLADCCDAVYLVLRQPDAETPAALELQQGLLETTGRLKGCILTQR